MSDIDKRVSATSELIHLAVKGALQETLEKNGIQTFGQCNKEIDRVMELARIVGMIKDE